jgi:hypothetical protein
MNESKPAPVQTGKTKWVRIPDGTKVRNRLDGQDGVIDGLTEIVTGSNRNPDGRTQYRVNVGTPVRKLAAEEELLILTGPDGLVLMDRQNVEYRRSITAQLHGLFNDDRFVAAP